MTENVFIVWGKNEALATSVAEKLGGHGYFSHVGGMHRAATPTSFFVNSNVVQQMDRASLAIVLAQRIYDKDGKPTTEFRPNLMFEWGYLLRWLRADAIHVFLINISRTELPSDLLGAYTHEITIENPLDMSPQATAAAAEEIATRFLQDTRNIDLDGLEIIQHYDHYRTVLLETASGKRAFSSRDIGYILLHMLQPAFYRDDFDLIKTCLKRFSLLATGPFTAVVRLIDNILKYYDVIASLDSRRPIDGQDHADEIRTLRIIEATLVSQRNKKDKIYNVFDVLLEDFIGLANLELHILTTESACLDAAADAFRSALKECAQFVSIYPGNDGFVRQFWESYIERNLSRVMFLKGDLAMAEALGKSGEHKRLMVITDLSAAGVTSLARQFELEVGLSRFDGAMRRGAAEAELSLLIANYIEPFKPREVDRLWDRLHRSLLSESQARNYHDLTKRLRAAKVHG